MIVIINRHVCKKNYDKKKKIAQHDCIFTRRKIFIFLSKLHHQNWFDQKDSFKRAQNAIRTH